MCYWILGKQKKIVVKLKIFKLRDFEEFVYILVLNFFFDGIKGVIDIILYLDYMVQFLCYIVVWFNILFLKGCLLQQGKFSVSLNLVLQFLVV